jgi:hypothetical protein
MSGPLTILNRVRERVIAGDWRGHIAGQGMEGWEHGPGCLLQLCAQEGDLEFNAQAVLIQTLIPTGNGIIYFNDRPARTPQDVIDLLDRAIALALKDNS